MDPDPRLAKALHRYQVISAYLAADLHRGQRGRTLAQLAARTWTDPDGEAVQYSAETLRSWARRYRKRGLDGLLDKERVKTGVRAIPSAVVDIACALKQQVPERTIDQLVTVMEALGHVDAGTVRRSTLHRALQERGLSARPPAANDSRDLDRFEATAPNDLWQADMLVGPFLPDPLHPGKVRRACLYAYLDDHSRLCLDGRFSFRGDLPALELCLRRSLQKWGVPRKVYYDNGQTFRSHHMRQICAHLGIHRPIHTTRYRPEGHGKIEAFNRQVRSFLAELRASAIRTLDELNEALWAWLDLQYHGEVHGETGQKPIDRWRAGVEGVRYADEDALRRAFLWTEHRTADKSGVFSLFGVRYQVGAELARRRFEIRYDPEVLHEVEIWAGGRRVERARPLEVHPWRRPKLPEPEEVAKPQVDGDWLGHLVTRHRAERVPEPDPRDWKRKTDDARAQNVEGLLSLLRERLDAHVVDEVEVRAWAARFGPVDLESTRDALDRLLERFPPDLHVRLYLDTLRAQEGS